MNKCDFCEDSVLRNGELVCPWNGCIKPQITIDEWREEFLKTIKKQ